MQQTQFNLNTYIRCCNSCPEKTKRTAAARKGHAQETDRKIIIQIVQNMEIILTEIILTTPVWQTLQERWQHKSKKLARSEVQ